MAQNMDSADSVDVVSPSSSSYPFTMLEMVILEDMETISYTFMCLNKKFVIDVAAEKLQGKGNLVDKLHEFIATIHDDQAAEMDFEDWIYGAVQEHVKRLAPIPNPNSPKPTTLLDLLRC